MPPSAQLLELCYVRCASHRILMAAAEVYTRVDTFAGNWFSCLSLRAAFRWAFRCVVALHCKRVECDFFRYFNGMRSLASTRQSTKIDMMRRVNLRREWASH